MFKFTDPFFTFDPLTLQEQKRQIWNLHVDRAEKIVVHKVDLPNVSGKRYECFYSKIVRDFRSGKKTLYKNVFVMDVFILSCLRVISQNYMLINIFV